jgi:predicted metal-dependent hydrolase
MQQLTPSRQTVVIRSPKRRHTISARIRGDVLEVLVPADLSAAEEAQWVERMRNRLERRRVPSTDTQLQERAVMLSQRYFDGRLIPSSVRWAENMTTRWGSCTPDTGTIRLCSRLQEYPDWVRDYVIVHEVAHLRYSSHGPRFWELVERYPMSERARGFLIAKGGDSEAD